MSETRPVPSSGWQDPTVPDEARLDALVAVMTLEEKVAQLGSVWLGSDEALAEMAPMHDAFEETTPWPEVAAHGVGQLTRVFGTAPVTAREGIRRSRQLQAELASVSRLKIPAIVHEECLTGFTTYGATVYPTALAWAATFDPGLVAEMASAIARDLRATGVHQVLAPVLDVVQDYRWGRVEETLGEDPYLVAELGTAYVGALERAGVVATLKHFAGYAASAAARNHAPVSMGPRRLADQVLPPFEQAIRIGGARSVMNSYADLDGLPVLADRALLTGLLRDTWGFTGTVVSDYNAVRFLSTMHRLAGTDGEAGALALHAGLDVELPNASCFGEALVAEVRAGRADEAEVDLALRRVLRHKLELGLLDAGWDAEGLDDDVDLDSPGNRDVARRLAESSVVLLHDDAGTLPLGSPRRIAVVGPCGDDPRTFFGCYAFPNHVIPQYPAFADQVGVEVVSLLGALREEFPDARVEHEPGCLVTGGDLSGLPAAVATARTADVVVLAVGDRAGLFGDGTSGEGCDVEDLHLPGHQPRLVDAVLATGRPVVLVAVTGRPYALGAYRSRTGAMVQSFFPGEEGGAALAGVLSGRVNPSGKLPVQIPAHPGVNPHTYLAPPLGQASRGLSNLDPTPAFGFGHGLSYTSFGYSGLAVDRDEVDVAGSVTVAVTVTNTGVTAGAEVAQLYVSDPQASVTRPVTQLLGFARVPLEAGAAARISFDVHTDRLAFTGVDLRRVVEPGVVTLRFGSASSTAAGPVQVRLVGSTRDVGPARVLSTPCRVEHVTPDPS